MKLALKLILIMTVLLAGVYAATPLWLPYILAGQLPPGWQLEELNSSYPGPAGINFNSMRVKGELGLAALTLTATDLHFEYRNLKTDIDKVNLDIYLQSNGSHTNDSVTLDDLSFPVEKLTGKLPQLSVNRMDVAVHFSGDVQTGTRPLAGPVMLDLQALELIPDIDGGFHLAGQLSFEDSLRLTGRMEVDAHPDLISAGIRFPSGEVAPWLDAQFEQKTQEATTTTSIDVTLNADAANQDWLDSVFARGTRRTVTQIGGKLNMNANFAGKDLQSIERLTLISENLHLLSDKAMLKLDADLQASRADNAITVKLAAPAKFEYQGGAGWLDELLGQVAPGLQPEPHSEVMVTSEIASGGSALILTGNVPSARFSGDMNVDLKSAQEHLTLKTTGLQIEMADINKPDSATVEGLVALHWVDDSPVAYTSDELHLTAGKLDITAEVTSRGGKLISTGSGSLTQASSANPVVSAEKLDLTWKTLDLDTLTGKLSTRTQGFSTRLDDQTWTGFDLDMTYTLLKQNDVSGKGKLMFASGPELPLEFTGNTQAMHWDIKLAPATIKLAKLRGLLSLAQVKLPAALKMTDGYLDLQGDIKVGDDITAKMLIDGHDMAASLHNSKMTGAGFSLNSDYGKTISASGPLSIETFELAAGIDVKNIRAELNLEDSEHFELKNLHAEVFDGQIELASLRYSGNEITDTTVKLSHVNLEKLLAYADIDGLQGSGFLDITLPVGSDQTGIHVTNGIFGSTGGGRLAYTKEGLAGTNIGMKALENFQFKDLSGTLNYQSDGAYLMAVRLEGKNPDLYDGHPVVFNLKINGSLPALFEALFMTGSFEESILKEIKSQQ